MIVKIVPTGGVKPAPTEPANVAPVKSFSYDPIGNLLSKSDVGTYTYPAQGPTAVRPHAALTATRAR